MGLDIVFLNSKYDTDIDHEINEKFKEMRIDPLWQDRDFKGDTSLTKLELRPGESLIDQLETVKDKKGNMGPGKLIVTNLRIIWQDKLLPRINISLGLKQIKEISTTTVQSKKRGNTQALHILALNIGKEDLKKNDKDQRYEFKFVDTESLAAPLVRSAQCALRMYRTSTMYRDVQTQAVLTEVQGGLSFLKKERLRYKIEEVYKESGGSKCSGTLYITNVRVVWQAYTPDMLNASIPYIQIESVKIKDKEGVTLVVKVYKDTVPESGGQEFGFSTQQTVDVESPVHVDSAVRLLDIMQKILRAYKDYSVRPVLGAGCERGQPLEEKKLPVEETIDFSSSTLKVLLTSYQEYSVPLEKPLEKPIEETSVHAKIDSLNEGTNNQRHSAVCNIL